MNNILSILFFLITFNVIAQNITVGDTMSGYHKVGQLFAFDEDGDVLDFFAFSEGYSPFYCSKSGMVYYTDKAELEIKVYHFKIMAKEKYTPEQLSVTAHMKIKVVPKEESFTIDLVSDTIVFYIKNELE